MADAILWAFDHGVAIGLIAFVLAIPVALAGVVYVWMLQGARVIAAVWVWRRFLHWWRTGRTDGAGAGPLTLPLSGGAGGYSAEYTAFMRSGAWAQQRERVLRRDGHRCQGCGGAGGWRRTICGTPSRSGTRPTGGSPPSAAGATPAPTAANPGRRRAERGAPSPPGERELRRRG